MVGGRKAERFPRQNPLLADYQLSAQFLPINAVPTVSRFQGCPEITAMTGMGWKAAINNRLPIRSKYFRYG